MTGTSIGIVKANPELALKAVNLRRYGQQVIERLGSKRVHPCFTVPGGVNAPLKAADREAIAGERETMVGYAQDAIGIAKGWIEENKKLADAFASFPSNYMGLVDQEGGLQLYDGDIRVRDAEGGLLAQFRPAEYLEYVAEHVEPWSFLKFPYCKKQGWPKGAYRVGPLGRLNVVDKIGTPLAEEEFKPFKQVRGGKPVENHPVRSSYSRSKLRVRGGGRNRGRFLPHKPLVSAPRVRPQIEAAFFPAQNFSPSTLNRVPCTTAARCGNGQRFSA